MYRLESVTKVYERRGQRVTALDKTMLEIPDNDFIAVVGPSGSGKTTAMCSRCHCSVPSGCSLPRSSLSQPAIQNRRMRLRLDDNQEVEARIKGKKLKPVCGDRVSVEPIPGEADWLITSIHERRKRVGLEHLQRRIRGAVEALERRRRGWGGDCRWCSDSELRAMRLLGVSRSPRLSVVKTSSLLFRPA